MEIKTFEVRDRATFIPVIAIKPRARKEEERYLWSRAGYGQTEEEQSSYILLSRITGGPINDLSYGPTVWTNRTLSVAHNFIKENWDSLINGQVIDVEFILGETKEIKKSERESLPCGS